MSDRKLFLHRTIGPLLISLFVPAMSPALAQPHDAISQCAAIEDETDRLACYDALQRATTTNLPETGAQSEPLVETPNQPAVEPQERRAGRFSLRRNRDQEDREQSVVVVSVRTNISDLRTFTTQDGRVFTQTSTDTVRHDEPPFSARLERASFGSFFLVPDGSRRGTRVSLQE